MKNLKTLFSVTLVVAIAAMAGAQGVDHRQKEQHKRIVSGVHHGSLTRQEAARLRAREAVIRAQKHRDRLAHHGHLTVAERRKLQHEENRTSRAIHRQKHDAQHRHP